MILEGIWGVLDLNFELERVREWKGMLSCIWIKQANG